MSTRALGPGSPLRKSLFSPALARSTFIRSTFAKRFDGANGIVPASTSAEILNKQRFLRPSSSIYQPQLTWIASIVNRATGGAPSARALVNSSSARVAAWVRDTSRRRPRKPRAPFLWLISSRPASPPSVLPSSFPSLLRSAPSSAIVIGATSIFPVHNWSRPSSLPLAFPLFLCPHTTRHEPAPPEPIHSLSARPSVAASLPSPSICHPSFVRPFLSLPFSAPPTRASTHCSPFLSSPPTYPILPSSLPAHPTSRASPLHSPFISHHTRLTRHLFHAPSLPPSARASCLRPLPSRSLPRTLVPHPLFFIPTHPSCAHAAPSSLPPIPYTPRYVPAFLHFLRSPSSSLSHFTSHAPLASSLRSFLLLVSLLFLSCPLLSFLTRSPPTLPTPCTICLASSAPSLLPSLSIDSPPSRRPRRQLRVGARDIPLSSPQLSTASRPFPSRPSVHRFGGFSFAACARLIRSSLSTIHHSLFFLLPPSLRFLWASRISVVSTCPRAVRRLERRRAIRVGATCISVGARRREDVVDRARRQPLFVREACQPHTALCDFQRKRQPRTCACIALRPRSCLFLLSLFYDRHYITSSFSLRCSLLSFFLLSFRSVTSRIASLAFFCFLFTAMLLKGVYQMGYAVPAGTAVVTGCWSLCDVGFVCFVRRIPPPRHIYPLRFLVRASRVSRVRGLDIGMDRRASRRRRRPIDGLAAYRPRTSFESGVGARL
ncbi:hypothetical protein C8J57DRAFT_1723564 [Mycena rebaudengoi]|nr:hypothetical protein C8J57DRAFT_1723564 [Mycena rebaudengoi]